MFDTGNLLQHSSFFLHLWKGYKHIIFDRAECKECFLSKGQGDVDWSEANKHRVKLIFVPYMRFLAHMVQICSDLRLNKLVFVLYMKFVARMVQISSALSRNKLISVPYLKFLVRMVQPYLTEYENSVLCGSYILV